jgi:two-component system KDP operon response regulator KdpE
MNDSLAPGRPHTALIVWDGPDGDLPVIPALRTVPVTDTTELAAALASERAAIVVLRVPPVSAEAMELVAAERRRRNELRAVVVTEAADSLTRLGALALGFDEAFPAVATRDELAGRIAILGERIGSSGRSALAIAPDLELDPVARCLRRRGRLVHLRPMEYRLLEELARHPGVPMSRTELLQRVWGTSALDGSRTVDVHVRWLRSKIERNPRRPVHLVTVRGTGYQLEPQAATGI